MTIIKIIDKLMKPLLKIIAKNRWGYTEEEFTKAQARGFFDMLNLEAMFYWLVAEPVCASHCMGCHHEGRPFYFNPMGLLIRHKCPPGICIHVLSQLSPIIYSYWDHLLQRKDPNQMIFDHVSCTDIGLQNGGLGDNIVRIKREKMPLWEFAYFMLSMFPYLFIKNKSARGKYPAAREARKCGGPVPNAFQRNLPINIEDLNVFMASPKRVRRLNSIERFKNHHIVIKIVSSHACIAGHKESDEFYLDVMGRVLNSKNNVGICIMALNKIWWRLILALEGMAIADEGSNFKSSLLDLPMSCYSAGLPLGICGKIMMQVDIRKI
jgi:hypothetical protein